MDTSADQRSGSSPVAPVPQRYWWLKRVLVTATAILFVAAGLRVWWGVYAAGALDREIAAIRARGEPVLPTDFYKPPIVDEQNAPVLLKQAATMLSLSPQQQSDLRQLATGSGTRRERSATARQLLELTTSARALARQARAVHQADWQLQWGLGTPAPSFQPYEHLTRLLVLAGLVAHDSGNEREAIESFLDALATGRHLQTFGPLLTCLIGLASGELVSQAVQEIGESLDLSGPGTLDAAKVLSSELLDDTAFRRGRVLAMQLARAGNLEALELVTRSGGAALLGGSQVWPNRIREYAIRPMFQLDGVRILRFWNSEIAAAAAANSPEARRLLFGATKPPVVRGSLRASTRMLSAMLLPGLGGTVEGTFDSIARMRMGATALAIRMYQYDKGAMPAALTDLAPAYLPAVPLDPCTRDQPIEYGHKAGVPYLLSVGCREVGGSVTPVRFWLGPRPPPATRRSGTIPAG